MFNTKGEKERMPFGATQQQKAASTTTEESNQIEWPWIPLNGGHNNEVKGGIRKIRLLPELDANGQLVQIPATDKTGKVIKGKLVAVTATETRFIEVWYKCKIDGKDASRRFFLDANDPWNNPYWNDVAKPTEKGSPERKAMKQRFAINVFDRTPVIIDTNGYIIYPDENGVHRLSVTGKIVDAVTGTPAPLNKVRILEQTAGQPNGKHFFQQLMNLLGTVEDSDGNIRDLHEFDVTVKITGADILTNRTANPTANFKPLTDEEIYLPRYNLTEWAKPWPNDAIDDLLGGKDYNDVIAEYKIPQYPELVTFGKKAETEELFD